VIARRYVHRLEHRAAELAEGTEREKLRQARRRATVANLLLSTFQIVVWSVVVMIILTSLGVNLGPLLATAGIAGVALGFGAQTIVRDTLSGFFILAENQFDVGDTVELQTAAEPVVGTVEALTLRITTVRAFDGTLNIVPNGNILVTSNKTRGWGRAIVDLRLPYDQDVDEVREILTELFDEIREVPPFEGALREGPEVLGIVQLTDAAEILRVVAETIPSKRWEIERVLREQMTNRLTQRGVAAPPIPVIAPHPTTM
jgi:small conductance mechanosensitive channel